MENNYLKQHLAKVDLSFLKVVKKEIIELQKKEVAIIPLFTNPTISQNPNWEKEIEELESYFASIKIPNITIKLKTDETISNIPYFIKNHIATVKNYSKSTICLPYLNRLQEVKKQLAVNKTIIN